MSHSISETDGSFAVTPSISGSPFSSRAAAEAAIKAAGGTVSTMGGRRRTLKDKTLRRMLKKKGMKTTGKKATLMKRLHMKGGMLTNMAPFGAGGGAGEGGRRRRRTRRGLFGY